MTYITNREEDIAGSSERIRAAVLYAVLITLLFMRPMVCLLRIGLRSDFYSYILLIPAVSAYLIWSQRNQLPRVYSSSVLEAVWCAGAGGGLILEAWCLNGGKSFTSDPDVPLSLAVLSYICLLAGGGFVFLGAKWTRAVRFPVAFLIFAIPLPAAVLNQLETASQHASAAAAEWFFTVSGTPILRDGVAFQLPGMMLRVAQECSGVRSSMVLLIIGQLAAYLYLKSSWRRLLFIVILIPLGILRNGFRIMVIGLLCVYGGPQMIESPVHRHGGPLFFVVSFVPLFVLLRWLRRSEGRGAMKGTCYKSVSAYTQAVPVSRVISEGMP